MKGKLSANPTRHTAVEAGDNLESSSASDLSGSDNNRCKSDLNDSGSEDGNIDGDDDEFSAARMTEGEA